MGVDRKTLCRAGLGPTDAAGDEGAGASGPPRGWRPARGSAWTRSSVGRRCTLATLLTEEAVEPLARALRPLQHLLHHEALIGLVRLPCAGGVQFDAQTLQPAR